jgi:hypothetical protein
MDARIDFDWLSSTVEDRKALYDVTRRLVIEKGISWPGLFHHAFGQAYAESFVETFGAGRMSRKRCAELHRWLRVNHPSAAGELDRALSIRDEGLPRLPPRFFRYAVPKMLGYLDPDSDWSRVPRAELARRLKERMYQTEKPRRLYSITRPSDASR